MLYAARGVESCCVHIKQPDNNKYEGKEKDVKRRRMNRSNRQN